MLNCHCTKGLYVCISTESPLQLNPYFQIGMFIFHHNIEHIKHDIETPPPKKTKKKQELQIIFSNILTFISSRTTLYTKIFIKLLLQTFSHTKHSLIKQGCTFHTCVEVFKTLNREYSVVHNIRSIL